MAISIDNTTSTMAVNAARMIIYAILAVLRPFIVIALSATSILGLLLCVFFALLVHGSHFPTGLVFFASVVSAVSIVGFYALTDLLLPRS